MSSPGRCSSFEALPFKGRVGWGWAFFLPRQNPSPSRPPPSRGQALPLEWEADKQMPSRWGRKNPCCTAIPGVPMKSRLLVLPLALLIAMPSLAATRGFEVRDMVNLDRYSRSEEHTSELQSLMRNSYAVFCLKNKTPATTHNSYTIKKQ